jgi:hypothetical protein
MMGHEAYRELFGVADFLYDSLEWMLATVMRRDLPREVVRQAEEAVDSYLRLCERRMREDEAQGWLPPDRQGEVGQ